MRQTYGAAHQESCTAPQRANRTRVLLVDDRHLLRGALAALLAAERDIGVVATAPCGDRIVELAVRLRAQVVVFDLETLGERWLGIVRGLVALPGCSVVALADDLRPGLLRRMLDAGVTGIVNTYHSPGNLAEAIRAVAAGGRSVDTQLALVALYSAPNPLTEREMEVLRIAADGAGSGEIAARLSLSEGTVRNYLSRLSGKIGARSRIDAIRIASSAGWM